SQLADFTQLFFGQALRWCKLAKVLAWTAAKVFSDSSNPTIIVDLKTDPASSCDSIACVNCSPLLIAVD
ncbi:hypothetical protein, partial [Sinorhizobium fredii]